MPEPLTVKDLKEEIKNYNPKDVEVTVWDWRLGCYLPVDRFEVEDGVLTIIVSREI